MAKWHGSEFKAKIKNNLKNKLMTMSYFVEAEAKRMCPVLTGNLRSSIHTIFDEADLSAYIGTSRDKLIQVSGIGTITFYAPYVEFGTYKMRARPYLRPALDALRAEIKK